MLTKSSSLSFEKYFLQSTWTKFQWWVICDILDCTSTKTSHPTQATGTWLLLPDDQKIQIDVKKLYTVLLALIWTNELELYGQCSSHPIPFNRKSYAPFNLSNQTIETEVKIELAQSSLLTLNFIPNCQHHHRLIHNMSPGYSSLESFPKGLWSADRKGHPSNLLHAGQLIFGRPSSNSIELFYLIIMTNLI